jgi:hypothetical protein
MRSGYSMFISVAVALMTGGTMAQEKTMSLDQAREGEDFDFYWASGGIESEGLEYGVRQAEKYYKGVSNFLGHGPEDKLQILLLGPAEVDGNRRGSPRVDSQGRIHLFRYGPTYHGYFGALPHEMVHSFRIQRAPYHDWFFEEGFAEFVALRVGKSMKGFPWYETPVTVAAGQWLDRGEDIPLRILREKHRDINMACRAQSYALRSSFFDWLGRTYGDETLLKLASRQKAGALEDYEALMGKPFDVLAVEWREAVTKAYNELSDADARAEDYRSRTPIQYMPVCRAGVDF